MIRFISEFLQPPEHVPSENNTNFRSRTTRERKNDREKSQEATLQSKRFKYGNLLFHFELNNLFCLIAHFNKFSLKNNHLFMMGAKLRACESNRKERRIDTVFLAGFVANCYGHSALYSIFFVKCHLSSFL